MKRGVVVVLLGISLAAAMQTEAAAASSNLTRAEIRAMPLKSRPDRPGHFYGNTVRWVNRARR